MNDTEIIDWLENKMLKGRARVQTSLVDGRIDVWFEHPFPDEENEGYIKTSEKTFRDAVIAARQDYETA